MNEKPLEHEHEDQDGNVGKGRQGDGGKDIT
jgi:hypothetical protein